MIPGLEIAPGEEKGYPLQYSGLENSMDYSPWGHKELGMTELLSLFHFTSVLQLILECLVIHFVAITKQLEWIFLNQRTFKANINLEGCCVQSIGIFSELHS